nr:hypothetical protein [uncultured bacterium]
MSAPLRPINLAARLSHRAVGNPEAASLASGVANCYPGLEFDHRNLDRRFLPGLVVEFDDSGSSEAFGAVVVEVDLDDPLLANSEHESLVRELTALKADMEARPESLWWIVELAQGEAVTARELHREAMRAWRAVRSLAPGPVRVVLQQFQDGRPLPPLRVLEGRRRPYLDEAGTIDVGFQAGELTQSLCSPWQHDFRDCGCHYWASNHPDIALVADAPSDPPRGVGLKNWLRARHPDDAPREMGHYELNQRFQDLPVVLGGRERTGAYRPPTLGGEAPAPYEPEELVSVLRGELAPLEHVLILEYLYAWSSVRSPDEVRALSDADVAAVLPKRYRMDVNDPLGGLPDQAGKRKYLRERLVRDVTFLREALLRTAVSEMHHLHWVNLLLRGLSERGLGAPYLPALEVAREVPTGPEGQTRPRALRPASDVAMSDFEGVEKPSGTLDGKYARVRVTLMRDDDHRQLFDIASRIVADGVDHFYEFRRLRAIIGVYDQDPPPYLRAGWTLAARDDPRAAEPLRLYERVLELLDRLYRDGSATRAEAIDAMRGLERGVDECARRHGLGVPFFPPSP